MNDETPDKKSPETPETEGSEAAEGVTPGAGNAPADTPEHASNAPVEPDPAPQSAQAASAATEPEPPVEAAEPAPPAATSGAAAVANLRATFRAQAEAEAAAKAAAEAPKEGPKAAPAEAPKKSPERASAPEPAKPEPQGQAAAPAAAALTAGERIAAPGDGRGGNGGRPPRRPRGGGGDGSGTPPQTPPGGKRKRRGGALIRALGVLVSLAFITGVVAVLGAGIYVWKLSEELPDYEVLARYEPKISTRVHAGDGELIADFARERRLFVPISEIPPHLIAAFLSAEDKDFYEHPGIDIRGIIRAAITNISNIQNDRRLVGASTITQQVAKNFLLSSEVSFVRKIKEAILATRIEQAFTKDQILELYLNEIFLGLRSYGVAAAAQNYFSKPLTELTLAEAAYFAALPKAPNNYHPFRERERAIARRNWVIDRMLANGYINEVEAATAKAEDLNVTPRRSGSQIVEAEYFVEEVRRDLFKTFGEDKLYEGGLSVRTTIDTQLQQVALAALRKGLVAYDRRHGWRGPVSQINLQEEDWNSALTKIPVPSDITPWELAVVLEVGEDSATIGLRPERTKSGKFESTSETGQIPFAEVRWARQWLEGERVGGPVQSIGDVLAPGDVVFVEPRWGEPGGYDFDEPGLPEAFNTSGEANADKGTPDFYALRQIPRVNGAIVAMDPHTGRVLAMAGGFSFDLSEFNRATQALRQTGSAFKPFVYAAALDRGYTPSSLILDAPFVMDQGAGLGLWKPENYGKEFYGPSTLRLGLEKSRNVMTVRLAQTIGMEPIAAYARRFGIKDDMPLQLAMALGAGETTLLRLTAAYAVLVNGGKKVIPTVIDRVQDRWGRNVYVHDRRECTDCSVPEWSPELSEPELEDVRPQILDARTAYQVTSMLEGVVQRGTATRVRAVGKPVAGKTGTTNEERDAWFMGFAPDLAVGVFVGFDNPTPLGKGETGGRVASPVFRDFMIAALEDKPATPFRIPPGVTLVRVNAKTGKLANPGDRSVIWEAFKPGTEPDDSDDSDDNVIGFGSVEPLYSDPSAYEPYDPGTAGEGTNGANGEAPVANGRTQDPYGDPYADPYGNPNGDPYAGNARPTGVGSGTGGLY